MDETSRSEARAYRREKLLEEARNRHPGFSDRYALECYSEALMDIAFDYAADGDWYWARRHRDDGQTCADMVEDLEDNES